MPKERTHLLLAEETLRLMMQVKYGTGRLPEKEIPSPYHLLGAILPDVLFYDLPFSTCSPLGSALHDFEGKKGLEFFKAWTDERPYELEFDAWSLGMVAHFLSDGLWHPLILELSTPPFHLCSDLRLSRRDCHHWIESELESFWLGEVHSARGYFSLLRDFRRGGKEVETCLAYFREFLIRAGFSVIPTPSRIKRCLLWQCLLQAQFGHPSWAKLKPWLLRKKMGKYVGALILPVFASLPALMASYGNTTARTQNPCKADFMARTVNYLATLLSKLPAHSL